MTGLTFLISALLPLQVLSLAEAIKIAEANHPQSWQAKAAVSGAAARLDQTRAPMLPQLSGQLQYQRQTANYAARPGALPNQLNQATDSSNFDTYNYYSGGLYLNQWLFDFGSTVGKYRTAQDNLQAAKASQQNTQVQLLLKVRLAYFQAQAQKALLQVASESLTNQTRHLQQIEGYVQVGTRPAIDLAQVRADVANARLQVINSENNYQTAKAQLRAAMGLEENRDFEVSEEHIEAISGEEKEVNSLLPLALSSRPELAKLEFERRAQESTLRSIRGGFWPALGLSMSLTEAGSELDNLAWNWSGAVFLNWPLFSGYATSAQQAEARANISFSLAQLQGQKQQIALELTQAHLAVRAAKEAQIAAKQVLESADERLRLAEGRYATGVGNGIELGDAQIVRNNAAVQAVVAQYNLATARAQLLAALGHEEK